MLLRPAPLLIAALVLDAPGPSSAPGPLEPLRFMAGCWRGTTDAGRIIEEHYTTPSANLILGMTRYSRHDVATGYEFTTIAWEDSTIVLTPRPEGQTPVPFRLSRLNDGSAAWENPAHDFPVRIVYRRVGSDTLAARIEGPPPQRRAQEWLMTRSPCR